MCRLSSRSDIDREGISEPEEKVERNREKDFGKKYIQVMQ
jgi:hypothetical protein